MNARDVLLRAAEKIASGKEGMCCLALWRRNPTNAEWKAEHEFSQLFHPNRGTIEESIERRKDKDDFWNKDPTPKRQNLRVLALLFAAETLRRKKGEAS